MTVTRVFLNGCNGKMGKVITEMVRKIRAGEKIRPRPLRKGDYLRDLYAEVLALAEKNNLIQK